MNNLLEEKLQRHYQIIEFLMFKNWVTISEVSQQTGISDRTIQKDVGEINTYIFPAKIETSVKLGIRIYYEHTLNAFYIFSALYRQSSRFLILEEIFLHNFTNLNALADHLALSESTLKRKIRRLNVILKPYDFSIDSLHMDIIGNEKKICNFFYYYLIEKYGVLDSLVNSDKLQLLSAIAKEFFEFFPKLYTKDKDCFSYWNRVRIMLFIGLKRIQKKHRLTKSDNVKGFCLSEKICKEIHYHYGITVDKKTVYQLFYVFFNYRYAWSIEELNEKASENETIALIVERLSNCFVLIEEKERILISNKEYVLLNLYNALTYSWGSTKILYQISEEFFVNLNNYYEQFTCNIKEIFSKQLNDPELQLFWDDSILNQMIFRFVTTCANLSENLEKRSPVVKAALFFNTSYDHTQFIMSDIVYHLKSRLDIEALEAYTISEITSVCQKYDMIITNLSIATLPNCSIVSIHTNPTTEDFAAILTLYNQIIDQKIDSNLSLLEKTNSIYQMY